jgi:GNAT superfamily N-acetyltransferase
MMNKNHALNSGDRIYIRKSRLSDCTRIADLLGQLGYPADEIFIYKKLKLFRNDPDETVVVAEVGGRVVGFISMHFIPQIALSGSFARISYLCVDEKHRGKNIGGKLEIYCEKIARKKGCDRIELHCHERRKQAHEFYGKQGYGESPKYFIKLLT